MILNLLLSGDKWKGHGDASILKTIPGLLQQQHICSMKKNTLCKVVGNKALSQLVTGGKAENLFSCLCVMIEVCLWIYS